PGVADLRGNVLDSTSSTVFSTGGPISRTVITGAVFDWAAGTPLANALVPGITPAMTGGAGSAIYLAIADYAGRFRLPFVRPGPVSVIALNDANRSFGVDRREAFDSASVSLQDSLHLELYAFVHDTIGPSPRNVSVRDSQTIVVSFTQPLLPGDSIT